MADQWSAQAVYEHFLNYFSMASVAILTDDCITQARGTGTLPSSVYWPSRKEASAELTSHNVQRRSNLSFPPQFTRQVCALLKQDNLSGHRKNTSEAVVDRMLSIILVYCWICLNAYLCKERKKKPKSSWEKKNPKFFLFTYTCIFNACNTSLSLFKVNLKLTTQTNFYIN